MSDGRSPNYDDYDYTLARKIVKEILLEAKSYTITKDKLWQELEKRHPDGLPPLANKGIVVSPFVENGTKFNTYKLREKYIREEGARISSLQSLAQKLLDESGTKGILIVTLYDELVAAGLRREEFVTLLDAISALQHESHAYSTKFVRLTSGGQGIRLKSEGEVNPEEEDIPKKTAWDYASDELAKVIRDFGKEGVTSKDLFSTFSRIALKYDIGSTFPVMHRLIDQSEDVTVLGGKFYHLETLPAAQEVVLIAGRYYLAEDLQLLLASEQIDQTSPTEIVSYRQPQVLEVFGPRSKATYSDVIEIRIRFAE